MPHREFDLETYSARIGLPDADPPSLALLGRVIAYHTSTIPFENLDIILGRPVRLDIASIQAKLVGAARGGYCFEQNTLLKAALEEMGFGVTSLMARVIRGSAADAITLLAHLLLRVDLPEGAYLADVGFGNLTPTAPIKLDCVDSQPTEHEVFRPQPLNGETVLQARLGVLWENVYRFSDLPTHPIDHEVANWLTSTRPDDLFTANVIAARPGIQCRKTLFNGEVTIRDLENTVQRFAVQSEPMLRDALRDHFGIVLQPIELTIVHAVICQFAERMNSPFRLD